MSCKLGIFFGKRVTSEHVKISKISYILTEYCMISIWAVIEQKMRMRCSVYSAVFQQIISLKKKKRQGKTLPCRLLSG